MAISGSRAIGRDETCRSMSRIRSSTSPSRKLATQTGYGHPYDVGKQRRAGVKQLKTITIEVAGRAVLDGLPRDVSAGRAWGFTNRGDDSRSIRLSPANRGRAGPCFNCPASVNGAFMVVAQSVKPPEQCQSFRPAGRSTGAFYVQFHGDGRAEGAIQTGITTEAKIDEAHGRRRQFTSFRIRTRNGGGGGYGGTRGLMWKRERRC